MNIGKINQIRATMGLEPRQVTKPKKKNNNAAIRAEMNRAIKAKRAGKSK